MIKKVEFGDTQKAVFNKMHGMINSTLVNHLAFTQNESLGENELRELECALEVIKSDAEKCLVIVREAKLFMGENHG